MRGITEEHHQRGRICFSALPAGTGSDEVKHANTFRVAVNVDARKLRPFTIITAQTVRVELTLHLHLDPDPDRDSVASSRGGTGQQTTETLLRFRRGLPECDGMRKIHVSLECYAANRCDAVKELAHVLTFASTSPRHV
jgi:hypothetical protein